MKTQIIKDDNGRSIEVFIPIEQWEHLKIVYPNLEKTDYDLQQCKWIFWMRDWNIKDH